eukprot:120207_1
MKEFSKDETLRGNDAYYCSQCKKHRTAHKQISVYRWPKVLVVCLKRFECSVTGARRRKLTTGVKFPTKRMDFGPFSDTKGRHKTVYDLYAVSNHSGGLSGGHYTADVMVSRDAWSHFSDTHYRAAAPDSLSKTSAYVLFYRRSE